MGRHFWGPLPGLALILALLALSPPILPGTAGATPNAHGPASPGATSTAPKVAAPRLGPPSAGSSAPRVGAPSPPTSVVVFPEDSAINVTWTAPASDGGSNVTGYDLLWSPAGNGSGSATVSAATFRTWVSGLTNGFAYSFQVAANNIFGTGPYSAPVTGMPGTRPGAPTNLSGAASNGTATFHWTAPPGPTGYPVLGYILNLTVIPQNSTELYWAASLAITIRGLYDGLVYRAQVMAYNGLGASPGSAPVRVLPLAVPDPPVLTGAVFLPDRDQIVLDWSAPVFTGGASVSNFTVRWSSSNGTNGTAHTGPLATGWTLSSAAWGTTYTFLITDVNREGQSRAVNVTVVVPPRSGGPAPPSATEVLLELLGLVVAVLLALYLASRALERRATPRRGPSEGDLSPGPAWAAPVLCARCGGWALPGTVCPGCGTPIAQEGS